MASGSLNPEPTEFEYLVRPVGVVYLNQFVLRESEPHGFRAGGSDLLLSALAQPVQGFAGIPRFVGPHARGAALLYFLVGNHPFQQGNKRTALLTTLTYLALNDLSLETDRQDAVEMIERIARDRLGHDEILSWLHSVTVPLKK